MMVWKASRFFWKVSHYTCIFLFCKKCRFQVDLKLNLKTFRVSLFCEWNLILWQFDDIHKCVSGFHLFTANSETKNDYELKPFLFPIVDQLPYQLFIFFMKRNQQLRKTTTTFSWIHMKTLEHDTPMIIWYM